MKFTRFISVFKTDYVCENFFVDVILKKFNIYINHIENDNEKVLYNDFIYFLFYAR